MTGYTRPLSPTSSLASSAGSAQSAYSTGSRSSHGSFSSSSPPSSPTYPPPAALSKDAPLRPRPAWSFSFPRPAENGQIPSLPISGGIGPALWAARIGSERWHRHSGSVAADVFTWAIVDSVLDRLTNYRSRVVQESKGGRTPSLPAWNEWLYQTDQLVFDAWEAAMESLPASRSPTDVRTVGRLCRTVMNYTWNPWHDSAPPPPGYNLRKPVPREMLGECDPRLESNRGIVCGLAGRQGREVGSVQWEVALNTSLLLKVPAAPARTYPRLDRARLPPKQSLEWETYHAPRTRVAY